MDRIGKLDFTGDDCIFYLLLNNREDKSIATFGNLDTNKLLMFLDFLDRARDVILIKARKVYKGTPAITEPDVLKTFTPQGMIWVKEDPSGEPLIIDDFDLYLGDDSLVFLFGSRDELTSSKGAVSYDRKRQISRCVFAYDSSLRLKYLMIKDLTDDEKTGFINKITERGIPLEQI